jgi:hypothetical protein
MDGSSLLTIDEDGLDRYFLLFMCYILRVKRKVREIDKNLSLSSSVPLCAVSCLTLQKWLSRQAPYFGLLCKVSKPVIQTALACGDKYRRIRFSLCPRATSLAEEYWRQPRTWVYRVIRRLPGNAVADFTASVILMILLSHWFIPVTISRNCITDAKA